MTWPIDITLPEIGESWEQLVHERPLHIERLGKTHMAYSHGEKTRYVVGIESRDTTLRFIPHIGPHPLLIFPATRILCPAHTRTEIVTLAPIYLRLGVGSKTRFEQLTDIGPARLPKALYGPVDSGRICRSVRAKHYISVEECVADTELGEETAHQGASHPWLELPAAAIVPLTIENVTSDPQEVVKIMVPLELIGLYQDTDRIYTGRLHMRLLSAQEAEITYLGAPTPTVSPVLDLRGDAMSPASRSLLFSHSYRNKTGLDFGF